MTLDWNYCVWIFYFCYISGEVYAMICLIAVHISIQTKISLQEICTLLAREICYSRRLIANSQMLCMRQQSYVYIYIYITFINVSMLYSYHNFLVLPFPIPTSVSVPVSVPVHHRNILLLAVIFLAIYQSCLCIARFYSPLFSVSGSW